MKFFKPTRGNILLSVVLFLIWFVFVINVTSFFGCSLFKLTYPNLPGQAPVETSLIHNISESVFGAIWFPLSLCSVLGLAEKYRDTAINLSYLFHFIFAYLISCVILFYIAKWKKQQKRKTAKKPSQKK